MPEKILLVDDDIDTLRLVGMMLESKGYEILAASSGEKALTLARNDRPDLIILDIMMPGINGFDLTQAIRQDESTQYIPIIIFTARTGMEDKVRGLELGADAYLTKPISTRELLAHVKAVIARSSKARPPEPVPGEQGQLIGIIAPRGGMGVTTTALNLGVNLARNSNHVILVTDFRPGQGTLGLELGHKKAEGFKRLLELQPGEISKKAIVQELIQHTSGLRLLLSSPRPADGRYAENVQHFAAIARHLPELARYSILDLGPGLTTLNATILPMCNQVLVVVEPLPISVTQAVDLINDLRAIGIGDSQIDVIMVNRTRSSIQLTISEVENQIGRSLAAAFSPNPELAYQASLQGTPMISLQPESLIAQQFNQLAARITHHH
jgi:DNA-binding response OmpR family regulator